MTLKPYVTLNTGQKMPIIGLGTSGDCGEVLRKSVRTALESGYRSIDTACLYKNEGDIGDELQDWLSRGRLGRDDVFVTSKLPNIGNRHSDVSHFLKMSLKKLKLEYLDLYLIHIPFGLKRLNDESIKLNLSNERIAYDFDTDLEDLWRGMEEQVESGRTKAIGISNFNISQIERILKIAKIPPAVNQMEVHCYLQQCPLVHKCQELGIAVVASSPLGAPQKLNEKRFKPIILEHPTVLDIAKQHSRKSSQVLLRFLLQQNMIVIPKSATPERIKSNFQVLDFHLSEEEMKSLNLLDRGEEGRVIDFIGEYPGVEKHKEFPFPIRN